MINRPSTFAQLTSQTFDVLVIGGGIVGSGVARDAVMRGLRVALLDRHDFAFGTSSRSSRLLHGGLRYLEQGRIRLVREASVEKMVLHRIAPHLAQPLGFIFPSYRPEGRPLWQLKIGVKLYDLLCGGRNLQPSHGLSSGETLQLVPKLTPAGLRGAVCYYDALTNDARLVIDTLRSASAHGAIIANYTSFLGSERHRDLWSADIEDTQTGRRGIVRARSIVNATGPWAAQIPHSQVRLRLSKGIHLVIAAERLSVARAVVITEGKRLLFVLPWGKHVIVGTTDTDYAGDPAGVQVDPADIRYVLRVLADFFPQAAITEADLISSWAGIRPLVANPDGTPSDISREHQILNPEPGWWEITGGKLTTYRLMAEQAVDRLMAALDLPATACRTAREPLLPPGQATYSGILPPDVSEAAVEHYVHHEHALTLTDVMVRRSGWHYYLQDTAACAEQVAAWMSSQLQWSATQRDEQLAAYRQTVERPVTSS